MRDFGSWILYNKELQKYQRGGADGEGTETFLPNQWKQAGENCIDSEAEGQNSNDPFGLNTLLATAELGKNNKGISRLLK